jgi:hypothetical protein
MAEQLGKTTFDDNTKAKRERRKRTEGSSNIIHARSHAQTVTNQDCNSVNEKSREEKSVF